jgi:hypothetical protein
MLLLKDLPTGYPIIELRTYIYGIVDHDVYRVVQDTRYLAIKSLAVSRSLFFSHSASLNLVES